ncbi:MAG TPA: TetR/AcrR family transcriptional regulator [Desulfopila sp.]|nr:TetR/AcrR family transcriptional regulator [Desulfopila sp.]
MSYTKSAQTRKRLMQTMSRLLRSQGFHATGIQQILQESGIPKGSLYYHFPQGKVELAAGSVENSAEILFQILSEIILAESDPVEALRIFCDFYIEELERENFTLGCPIATITLEAAAVNDQIHQACRRGFAKMSAGFIDLLVGQGIPATRASELATFALASIEGALILCKAQRSTQPLVIIRDNLCSQVAVALSEQKNI